MEGTRSLIVLFDVQDKALRSLLSGMFFTRKEQLSSKSSSPMLGQDGDVREVIVVWLKRVQRFPCPGKSGESGNDSRPVPTEEQGRCVQIYPPDGRSKGAHQRPHNRCGARVLQDDQGVFSGIRIRMRCLQMTDESLHIFSEQCREHSAV